MPPCPRGSSALLHKLSSPVAARIYDIAHCSSPKLHPHEKSCGSPAWAVIQKYVTTGRVLERLGALSRRLDCDIARHAHQPGDRPICSPVCSSSIITQLDRNGDASRPVALEKRRHPDPLTDLCLLAFLCSGQGEFGPHGSSGHNRITAVSSGVHWRQ